MKFILDHPAAFGGGGFFGIAVGGLLASFGYGDRESNQSIGAVIGLVLAIALLWHENAMAAVRRPDLK